MWWPHHTFILFSLTVSLMKYKDIIFNNKERHLIVDIYKIEMLDIFVRDIMFKYNRR